MNAALEFELLKARRAGVFRWGAVVVAVGVPALSTAFFELVRLGGDSPSAAKAATMITELSLAGLLGTAGQVLSVAILMTAGIAASWSFGREFVDDALPALFAIATPRSSVAAAKFVVLAGWALLTVVSTVILTVVGGLLVGLDMDAAAVQTASRVAAAGLLGAALAAPIGAGFQLAPRLPARNRRPAGRGGRDAACHRPRRRRLVPLRSASTVDGHGRRGRR